MLRYAIPSTTPSLLRKCADIAAVLDLLLLAVYAVAHPLHFRLSDPYDSLFRNISAAAVALFLVVWLVTLALAIVQYALRRRPSVLFHVCILASSAVVIGSVILSVVMFYRFMHP